MTRRLTIPAVLVTRALAVLRGPAVGAEDTSAAGASSPAASPGGDPMMRRRAGTVVPLALVLGTLAAPVAGTDGTASTADATISASTQPADGPVVLGGRIEVLSVGFAITVPEGWYAFDVTHPDIAAHLASFDDTTALYADGVGWMTDMVWLGPPREPNTTQGAVHIVPPVGPDLDHSCWAIDIPFADPLDVAFDEVVETLGALPDLHGDVDHGYIDLPVGRAGRARYAFSDLDGVGTLVFSTFILVGHGRAFELTCLSGVPHHDEWLAIAETWEWLAPAQSSASPLAKE